MNSRTDNDLISEYARTHSEASFAELVERHISLVYSVAVRVVADPHLAEDVTQTTFATLAREAHRLAGRNFLSSWLHRTASNQASNLVRREMRRRSREQESYAMQTPEEEAGWKKIAPFLDAAIDTLHESDRNLIVLRYFEKKTSGGIGLALKLSEEAAQKRISRALERLRKILAGQGANISTVTLGSLIIAQGVIAAPLGLSASVSTAVVAGGALAGGIALSTIKLMLMSKLKIVPACGPF